MSELPDPITFIAHLDDLRIYRGDKLIALLPRDKLPALIYEAAKVMAGR